MTKTFKALRTLTKSPASPQASEELMEWFKEKPQTYGWGAILAYDRQKANKMLKQEYISRFNSESVLLPVSIEVSGGGERKLLFGYEFDAPLMSFENYDDDDIKEEPRCVLRMPIIAGSYMTVQSKGIVTSITVLDPLDGQVLSMIMDLKTGTVNSKEQVVFNIAEGTDFLVDVNQQYLDQVDVGNAFKAYFEESVPEEKKVWVLSEIDTSKNEYLRPSIIKLQVRKREGTAEIAEGELLVLVSMEGDEVGTSLPEDFKYLTADNSATLILGQKTLLAKVIPYPLRVKGYSTGVVPDGLQWRLNISGHNFPLPDRRYNPIKVGSSISATLEAPANNLDLTSSPDSHYVKISNNGYAYESVSKRAILADVVHLVTANGHEVKRIDGMIYPEWNYTSAYAFVVADQGRGVVSTDVIYASRAFDWSFSEKGGFGEYAQLLHQSDDSYFKEIHSAVDSHMELLTDNYYELNTFILESILFKNEDTVSLSSCAMPNDLVMFGEVGPSQAAYEITPMEAVMLNGETQQFAITPQGATDVTWSIESASGDPLYIGSIDAASGLYTAPDLSDFQGSQARVRVIATQGSYTTYALVSVLRKTITVNPLVTVKIIGESPSDSDKVTLTANTADGIPPKWSLKKTDTEGTLAVEEGFSNVYTPRPYDDVQDAYVVDEVLLTDSKGFVQRAIIVVDHGVNINSAMTEGSATATTVQLQCKVGKDDVTLLTEFNVLLGGGGTISETGLYTQATEVKEPFALVGCNTSDFGRSAHSYILIPLPLSPYEGGE